MVAIPRLGQRVMPAPANVSPPVWVDDANFDIDVHVRRIACPKPGTLRQVLDLASLMIADPFDRTRPLWQFVIVEGMRGGKAAMIQKMHHTITDGERGVELSMQYLDFERDAPEPPPVERIVARRAYRPIRSGTRRCKGFIAAGLRFPIGMAKQVRDLLADPAGLPDASSAAAKTFKGIVSQLSETDGRDRRCGPTRSLHRRVETAEHRSARPRTPRSVSAARSTRRS